VYPDIRLESQELQYSPRLLYDIVEDAYRTAVHVIADGILWRVFGDAPEEHR